MLSQQTYIPPDQIGLCKNVDTPIPSYSVKRLSRSTCGKVWRLLYINSSLLLLVLTSAKVTFGQEEQPATQLVPSTDSDVTLVVESVSSVAQLKELSLFREPLQNGGTGPKMVVIPQGEFDMGCLTSTGCFEDEVPPHKVEVKKFAVSQFEITFDQYQAFAGAALRTVPDDSQWGRGSRPAIHVSWYDAVAYTKWLSAETGANYRLPTEAEWEYAGRAGTNTKYSWGDDIVDGMANCDGCNDGSTVEKTTEVGQFKPNPWHLYDIHGNVWEWTLDCWNRTYGSAPQDGSAWTTGDCARRVVRGGSWIVSPYFVRSATRNFFSAENRVSLVGFRVVRELDVESAEET